MKKQFILLAFFTGGLALIEACSCFTSCGCGGADDAPAFFDFKKTAVEHKQGIGTETLRLILRPDSIQFLAMELPRPRWNGFMSSAYACSPAEGGREGLKFPVTKIEITADQPFNDTMPAGVSLNSFFQMATDVIDPVETEIWQNQLAGLDALNSFIPFGYGPYWVVFVTKVAPEGASGLPFKFTVTITKSDSTSVAGTSGEIFF